MSEYEWFFVCARIVGATGLEICHGGGHLPRDITANIWAGQKLQNSISGKKLFKVNVSYLSHSVLLDNILGSIVSASNLLHAWALIRDYGRAMYESPKGLSPGEKPKQHIILNLNLFHQFKL